MDKAGKEYWNDLWTGGDLPAALDPRDPRLRNWINRRFHQAFQRAFAKCETSSMTLLEVGCGKSALLPYFVKEFHFKVFGLDYSPIGCEKAKAVLQANGVEGDIVCADLFAPPDIMVNAFDVVVSNGVVEHFEDTASCISAVSRFIKPGGLLITNIPNMVGWIGSIQAILNRPVYEIHQLLTRDDLQRAHERAGLKVLECDYFLYTSFGVNNLAGVSTRTLVGFMKKLLLALLARVSMVVWRIEDLLGDLPPNRLTSPYIKCLARKV